MYKMPSATGALLKVFLFHILFFLIIRLVLLVACYHLLDKGNDVTDILLMFFTGLRFDTAVLCYVFMPAIVLVYSGLIFDASFLTQVSSALLQLLLPILLFVSCADIPYFVQFQKHLSKEFFTWFGQGWLSFKLIFSDFAYWGYGIMFIPFAYGSIYITRTSFKKITSYTGNRIRLVIGLCILSLFAFAGARGRFSIKSPLHPGAAYVSQNLLINQGGLNANFTLLNSILYPVGEVDVFDPAKESDNLKFVKTSLGIKQDTLFVRQVPAKDTLHKMNVVVVLMESMSRYKTGYLCNKVLAPRLMELAGQGVFFDRFYSAGIHTYNGIFSTVTGYPAILHEHMMENYVFKRFNGLPAVLAANGYHTSFFTSHDEQFDNMGGFLTFNGVQKIYTDRDYPSSVTRTTMGIPDHELFSFAVKKMNEETQPFFSLLLTSSDHGPWDIPTNIPFQPNKDLPEDERATQYADWSIGCFMNEVRKQKWFDNTLFVFLGDHGGAHGSTYEMDFQFNYIPCVFYAPSLLKPLVYKDPALQIDVFPTIMGCLGLAYTNHGMGIDLFADKRPYAYFSADDKLGCLDTTYFYYHLIGPAKEALYRHQPLEHTDLFSTMKQRSDSMKHYMEAMMQSAVKLLKKAEY